MQSSFTASLVITLGLISASSQMVVVDPYLPFTASQSADSMETFVRNCRIYASGNTNGVAPPSTYFSKMPKEWLTSNNNTIATTAKKFEANFTNLGASLKPFYAELCPKVSPMYGMYTSVLVYPASQSTGFDVFIRNCIEWATCGRNATLDAPSSYFNAVPNEWIASGIEAAKKYRLNMTSLNAEGIRCFYDDLCPCLTPMSNNTSPPRTTTSVSTSGVASAATTTMTNTTPADATPTGSSTDAATAFPGVFASTTRASPTTNVQLLSGANPGFASFEALSSVGVLLFSAMVVIVL